MSTKFSCRLLFGPTVVPYFACNEGFIYLLLSYVYIFFCYFLPLLFVCHCFCYWFFSVFLAYFCAGFPDIFPSDFWDFDQVALLDGPIQRPADRLKTTVLSSKANSTSLLYNRACTASGRDSPLLCLTGMFYPLNPFMLHCTYTTPYSSIPLV